MEPDLRLIRSFVALARETSFTRAAASLGISQPTLSSQILRLEDTLGFSLFDRSTRQVVITREGAELLKSSINVMSELERLSSDVRRLRLIASRALRIGAGFFTTEIQARNELLQDFAEAYEDVRLSVVDAAQSELISAVAHGRLDGAIVLGNEVEDGAYFNRGRIFSAEGTFPQSLRRQTIGVKPVELLIPQESKLARYSEIPQSALTGVKVATIDPSQGPGPLGEVMRWLKEAGAEIVLPFESRHAMAVERYGIRRRIPCVTLGWFQVTAEHATMVRRPIQGLSCQTDLVLLMNPARDDPPPRSAFANYIAAWKTGQT